MKIPWLSRMTEENKDNIMDRNRISSVGRTLDCRVGGRGSIPGAGPILGSSNNWEIKVLPLHCISSGSNDHVKWSSGGSLGGTRGAWAPLIFRPNWGPKGRKIFLETPPPLYLRVWMTWSPLSQGLYPALSEGPVSSRRSVKKCPQLVIKC